MPGSLTYSSKGGAIVSQTPEGFETPITSQTLLTGQTIRAIGIDADGVAPEEQIIAIQANTALTLPIPIFTAAVFKKGQIVQLLNMGTSPITFPSGAFNPTSKSEVLECAEMLSLIFMPQVGWIPCDDDADSNKLPKQLWNGSDALPANGRILFHEKGVVLKKGNLPTEPTSRLETSSFAPGAKTVGSSIALTSEEHTVVLGGGSAGTFTLPVPTTCPGRMYRLISESARIDLLVSGGSKVLMNATTPILSIDPGKGLDVQSINGFWRKVGGF
jgi:hypothetical protein